MRWAPLLVANLLRKKTRTALTVGSFLVALFLFGLLATVRFAFNAGVDVAGVDRLIAMNRVSFTQLLPIAYQGRLARVDGVSAVAHMTWFGGVYKDEKNFFPQFALETDTWREIYPEYLLTDAEWQAFLADPAGCIAGLDTAQRFHWKVGDVIPIKGAIYEGNWEFTLRGIYRGKRPIDDTTQFWFHQKYLDDRAPAWMKSYVGWYVLKIQDPDRSAAISKEVDELFANSAWPTRTMTEKAMASSFVKQMGNIEFLVLSIGSVVFFTLLLVTGNTLAGAVRERTAELAVLKAVGCSDFTVMALVMAESLLIAVSGGVVGLVLAKSFTLLGDPTGGILGPQFYMPNATFGVGLALTVVVGLLAGALPAFSAMRLRVVDALRRI